MMAMMMVALFISAQEWDKLSTGEKEIVAVNIAKQYFQDVNPLCRQAQVEIYAEGQEVKFHVTCVKQEI